MVRWRIVLSSCFIFLCAGLAVAQTSQGNSTLATVTVDNAAQLNVQRTFLANSNESIMQDVTFSPDNNWLAVIERKDKIFEGRVRFWDAKTFEEKHLFQDESLEAMSIGFSPDGWYLAAGTRTGEVVIADMRRDLIRTVVEADTAHINAVAFNPGDQFIAVASGEIGIPSESNFAFRVVNIETGEESFSLNKCGDICPGPGVSVSFDLTNSLVASATTDGTVRLWDFELGEEFATLDNHVPWINDMMFTPDGNALVYVATDGIRIWNIKALLQKDGKKDDYQVIATPPEGEFIQSIALNPDGTVLAVGYLDSTIKLWNLATGEQLTVLSTVPLNYGIWRQANNSLSLLDIRIVSSASPSAQTGRCWLPAARMAHSVCGAYLRTVKSTHNCCLTRWCKTKQRMKLKPPQIRS
jgi:WD40 repeat protein